MSTRPAGVEEPEKESLTGQTVRAAKWQMAASLARGGLQFGVMVLLARLLSPADFGLVALAMIVVAFAEMVVDLGLGPAIVQRETLREEHLRVSFTVSILIGATVATLLATLAPLVAPLLGNPAVSPVLRWMSLLFAFAGLGATARAVLERRLDFRGLFLVALASYGIGYVGVGVTLALLGYGVWSLVGGAVVQAGVAAAASLVLGRHPLRPLLAREPLRDLLNFGAGVMLNRGVVYVSYQGDNFVVGRWLGAPALGLYSRAFQLMIFPLYQLQSLTWNVLFSAYSRLQGDRRRAASAYTKGIQLTTLAVAPVMAGMAVAGPHLIVGLYGPQWVEATFALQVLCLVGALRAVYGTTGALTHAFGEVYAEFRRQGVYAALVVAAAVVGARWGISGVALGAAGAVLFMYVAMAQLGVRISGCGWSGFFRAQLPGALIAVWVAAVAGAARVFLEGQGAGSGTILVALVLTCAAALPAGVYLLPDRLRPAELFHSLDGTVGRLPAALRLPVRRVLRLSPEGAATGP